MEAASTGASVPELERVMTSFAESRKKTIGEMKNQI